MKSTREAGMTEIKVQDEENVRDFIDDIIDRFGEARGQPFGYSQFAFEALDNGERVGAIVGHRLYDWLYVEYLAVAEAARGDGVGSQLLERAEAYARDLTLKGVALDSFRYQAPSYYEARGYIEQMVVPGKVPERDRIFFQKELDGV